MSAICHLGPSQKMPGKCSSWQLRCSRSPRLVDATCFRFVLDKKRQKFHSFRVKAETSTRLPLCCWNESTTWQFSANLSFWKNLLKKNHFKTKKNTKNRQLISAYSLWGFTSEVPKDDLQHMHPDGFFSNLEGFQASKGGVCDCQAQ